MSHTAVKGLRTARQSLPFMSGAMTERTGTHGVSEGPVHRPYSRSKPRWSVNATVQRSRAPAASDRNLHLTLVGNALGTAACRNLRAAHAKGYA